ncbi:MAG: helix-turn-helix domain-containing protein, partial [Acetobacterium sp.]|nr:helix-turn-helix domain-containing protein [Acetobacterium sp.]
MPAKSKFQPEEKELIVNEYLAGTFGVMELSRRYNVDPATLHDWVRLYQSHGIDGVTPKSTHTSYSFELKANAVMDYQSGNLTVYEVCTKYDIKNISQLKRWEKRYTNHELTKSSHSGGTKLMTKGRKTTRAERIEIVAYCIEHGKDYAMTIKKYDVSYQ